jgi:hypothetical protein
MKGLQRLGDTDGSSSLSKMAKITHKYYSDLYSQPSPNPLHRDVQWALLQEVEAAYGHLLAPPGFKTGEFSLDK